MPHLPLLQLQTSSALSHIFPEIRLDAARLVHLFLEHIPKHITSSWPTSDSTILEGLRLTVGLGGDKGASSQGGRLGAQGKLVTLRTILAFIRTALGYETGASADEIFESVFGESTGCRSSKRKGKARQVGEHGLEEQYEGFLVGCSDWGLEEPSTGWEIGRMEATSSLSGKEVEIEALSVSFRWHADRHIAKHLSNCIPNCILFSFRRSSRLRRTPFLHPPLPSLHRTKHPWSCV